MVQDSHIKELLSRIKELNPKAFEEFTSKQAICFQPKKGNWLFPMMFDYYVNKIKDDAIIEIIKELGMFLHKKGLNDKIDAFFEDMCSKRQK